MPTRYTQSLASGRIGPTRGTSTRSVAAHRTFHGQVGRRRDAPSLAELGPKRQRAPRRSIDREKETPAAKRDILTDADFFDAGAATLKILRYPPPPPPPPQGPPKLRREARDAHRSTSSGRRPNAPHGPPTPPPVQINGKISSQHRRPDNVQAAERQSDLHLENPPSPRSTRHED